MLQGVKRTVLACAIMLPALTPSNAATIQNASTVMAPTRDQDRRDIEQLVVQFKAALSAKDAVALTALFYGSSRTRRRICPAGGCRACTIPGWRYWAYIDVRL
ncbi:MAG: hypothetical protein B7Y98_14365 [Sphingomonas sp. 32-62-10]|nr:MAG: hypothetical protein B7Y98_14365 [Sphingomonas sp. 32-62-10]